MPRGLSREKLVEKALEIVDREGLDALSMRKLGAELGVDPMAAYRHLPNKDALLDGVMEAVISQIDLDVDESMPWQDQLRQLARANLDAMLSHPNAVPLLAKRPLSTPRSLLLVEKAFRIMSDAGVQLYDAGITVNVLSLLANSIALASTAGQPGDEESVEAAGALLAMLPRERFPLIHEAFETGQLAAGFDEVLDYAIDAMIERLERHRTATG